MHFLHRSKFLPLCCCIIIINNLIRTDFAWAKALGYTGAAWTEVDAVEVGGSTADNQIIEYQFLGGQVSDWSVSFMLSSNWSVIGQSASY